MDYRSFFEQATGHPPFPYQSRLAAGAWPEVIDVPTGLGKTAAVAMAWLHGRLHESDGVPRRLVWCLPMRTLVAQTASALEAWVAALAPLFEQRGLELPSVHVLMGGVDGSDWDEHPERSAALIGTQDMLLSRALMRGYGMSRYRWPLHFAALHNDALWVLDETQLMGVGVETSAQLEGLRHALGTATSARTIWMSATMGLSQIATVDHPQPEGGRQVFSLNDDDHRHPLVQQRTGAKKALVKSAVTLPEKPQKSSYAADLAAEILERHVEGTLTLVVLNRVSRAQALYQALSADPPEATALALLHSRFRPPERAAHEDILHGQGGRIVVSTQVVEAGVDVSARTLFTELAPWPSLVQRFGRCNRYGETDDATAVWIDAELDGKQSPKLVLPYDIEDLRSARERLEGLVDAGPAVLRGVAYEPPDVVRPVLRRKDLLELFDTTADLAGHDLDVSRWVRDSGDTDVALFWRDIDGPAPQPDTPAPSRHELCSVSVGAARRFVDSDKVDAWTFDPLAEAWQRLRKGSRIRPGMEILVASSAGGYSPALGWTSATGKAADPVPALSSGDAPSSGYDEDRRTAIGRWLPLTEHLDDVVEAARALADQLRLPPREARAIEIAARWHDLGKAHPVFQRMLTEPGESDEVLRPPVSGGLWAKSNHRKGRASRPYFRHELASALAFLQHAARHGGEGVDRDLVAYLIAAHHGKVRLSIRSLPGEKEPDDGREPRLYARGVWHADELPPVDLGADISLPTTTLDLSLMALGQGSWLERTLSLRDDPEIGPFRLAWWESLVRIADWRASAQEAQR